MPIPKPSKNETKDDFIGRCMSDDEMQKEFPDRQQRLGVCQQSFDDEEVAAFTESIVKCIREERDRKKNPT